MTCPEGLPEFPDKAKFVKELNDLIVYFSEKQSQIKIRNQLKLNKTDPGLKMNHEIKQKLEFDQITMGINSLK